MAKRLMNLRNVPVDELDDISALLEQHDIGFYVIEPSMWGVNGGGIWIEDDARLAGAKEALAEYQAQRQASARAQYAAEQQAGTAETFRSQLHRRPAQVIGAVVGIILALALLALPYFLLR